MLLDHYRLCPFAQRTLLALNAGGCKYNHHELSEQDLYEKPTWFLELNPVGYGGGRACRCSIALSPAMLRLPVCRLLLL